MAFDGITLKKIVSELKILEGSKINYIYEPDSNTIVIGLYNGIKYALNIDISANNYRINLTTNTSPNPLTPPNFCMLLRKYLEGSKITKINMNGLERICYIDFECISEIGDKVKRTLVIELMGKYSNVILVKENMIIIDALKRFDSTYKEKTTKNSNMIDNNVVSDKSRDIMPGRHYIKPEANKREFENISEEEFITSINESEEKTLDTAIVSLINGVSIQFVKSALEENKLSNTIANSSIKSLYKYINKVLENDCQNAIIEDYKNGYTVKLKDKNTNKNSDVSEIYKNLQANMLLDDFYSKKQEEEDYKNFRNSLLKILSNTLDKIVRKLDNINDKIKACEDMEQNKISGELLLSNIYRFTENYEKAKQPGIILITEDTEYVELENYYDNNKLLKIRINPKLTISKNADKYFKKYNKEKNTLQVTKIQKEQTQKELNYIESLVYELDNCKTIQEVDEVYNEVTENILFTDMKLNRKEKKTNKKDVSMLDNYIRLKVDDYDVFIGKNNKQNDYLTLKVAKDNDYWFHTKDIHGSHLILKCNGQMPKEETIIRCAELASYYSKAKFSSNVPVDYTLAKYVKKPKGTPPGYVIFTNNKTVYVNPSNG